MAFLIFLQSVPGIDRAQTTPSPIPTTYAHATHGLKPNNQNANPHLCSVRSRCALRGLRTGSKPLKSQSKRLLENEIRRKPQGGKGKAEMLALSTSAASGWTAYPVLNQSNRGVAIYLLDILSVRRIRVSYVRGEVTWLNEDLPSGAVAEGRKLPSRPLRN